MNFVIRKMKRNDCFDLARVVTISWNETYKGIVPDYFLKELYQNEEERAKKSFEKFDRNNNNTIVLEVNGKVEGFVHYGKTKDNNYEDCGEIFALYIINKYHGYGQGKNLVNEAKKELRKMGFNKMIICCLKGNPSNKFYEHVGGKYIKDSVYKRLNLSENVYYYDSI